MPLPPDGELSLGCPSARVHPLSCRLFKPGLQRAGGSPWENRMKSSGRTIENPTLQIVKIFLGLYYMWWADARLFIISSASRIECRLEVAGAFFPAGRIGGEDSNLFPRGSPNWNGGGPKKTPAAPSLPSKKTGPLTEARFIRVRYRFHGRRCKIDPGYGHGPENTIPRGNSQATGAPLPLQGFPTYSQKLEMPSERYTFSSSLAASVPEAQKSPSG